MNKLTIEPTEFTPKVILDHTQLKFEITGELSPENAKDFFAPILAWFDDFYNYLYYINSLEGSKKEMDFVIHVDYFTSSALKCLYDVFKKTVTLKPYLKDLKITWLYDNEDLDMKENGEEFATMLDIPFVVKPLN